MKKIILIILALSLTVSLPARKLVILHTNDTHSHMDPVRGGVEEGRGGVIERAAFVDSVRRADGRRNVLLLDAGDFSQGTSYFPMLHGDIEVDVINAMKYDVVTLGNHEFDNGIDELARRVGRIECPVVCANYDFSKTSLGKLISPYAIVKRAGLKIGIIGLLTEEVKSVIDAKVASQFELLNTEDVVNKWASYLKKEKKCDLVICLTHLGYDVEGVSDRLLARNTTNVDIIVGGHSHTFLKDIDVINNQLGEPVQVVTDGCWGLNVGQLVYEY